MKEQIYRTSKDWLDELQQKEQIKIIDPIGWDQQRFIRSFYEELITEEEFKARLELSKTEIIEHGK